MYWLDDCTKYCIYGAKCSASVVSTVHEHTEVFVEPAKMRVLLLDAQVRVERQALRDQPDEAPDRPGARQTQVGQLSLEEHVLRERHSALSFHSYSYYAKENVNANRNHKRR